ncbi:ABC transporter substrate-binding protein [Halalkalibacter akibai]|uniref:Thiamine pyrimidine synthase n=1 Tax=Halalkalibacter akibai (strain ATCC 43226 / DSM 21942 / CIP 109018 / JCM 9157 / 1139) TaxID=1236973 RepID=W4QY81_HALA3|nr:ABC transporter substrate-binding protein [Halalkalibacter akibai]GAE37041.1 hydroxymethylpyrimidine ABC transporter [Halalkalibacter akibai JCM 9157]
MTGKFRKKVGMGLTSLMLLVSLSACGGEDVVSESGEAESVKLVLNWFPKSQHGGVFAADDQGIFAENNLDVQIEAGGPQVSSIQIVASGNAEFGLAHADQIVIARNEGIELVTLATVMQNSPAALMFHEGKGIQNFEDLNGRTAYIQPGIPYWDYLNSKYDLSEVTELGYTGQHVNFINDLESVSQAFVTSEPFFLGKEGVNTETMLVSESGFDPYNVVLFATKDYIAANKDTVQRFVTSFVEGWNYYEESPYEINEIIHEANPNLAVEDLEFETDAQKPFVYGGDAEEHGFGYMTEERWKLLIEQLVELGLLEEEFDANDIFTTEFLPSAK